MYKRTFSFYAMLFFVISNAQEIKKESVFEGTFNNEIIQIYIQSFNQECTGNTYYRSIVRYLDLKRNERIWRKFQIFANNNNGYILIDDAWNTGRYSNYIFLNQKRDQLEGYIKNEKNVEKPIYLKRTNNIKDFSLYRKKMDEFDETNDC